MPNRDYKADVIIAGGGLAGLATAFELLDRGLQVLILERDKPEKLGGLAKESFGGILMVDTPLQR
ncbi:MAG: FAD-dependent oxidoreductase, partial [Calditrichaeota bacterium]|nr:FAD-dependent oxidoreductase [Calditrichota bacterium]